MSLHPPFRAKQRVQSLSSVNYELKPPFNKAFTGTITDEGI